MQIRCPHCQNPIEILDDESLSDIACPSCGSGFGIIGDETIKVEGSLVDRIGHFTLVEKLGVGGFGTVWKANDIELDRTVAIKVPRKGQLDGDEIEQFLREARTAAQLKHPNIVSVHEVGRDNGQVYIVSDFVDGITLADWITGQQPTPSDSAELCRKIAEALHHAHEHGVIHRDLKPGNIMLDKQGEPHIMDFGLAKREAGEITMTVAGKILGTPAYMSPEQARGEGHAADARSDLYSLGVIMYELLTGERPFRGNQRMLLHQVLHEEPKTPRALNDRIPKDLETITLKCMEKEKEIRYRNSRDVAEELTRFLNREPIQARPITKVAKLLKWSRRNPTRAALTVLIPLTVLLIAGLTIGYRVNRNLNSANDQLNSALVRTEDAEEAEKLANEKLQQQLYFRHLAAAHADYERNNLQGARRYLAECPEKYRHFEWNYLSRLCNQSLRTLVPSKEEGSGRIWGMAVSPNGRYLATAGEQENKIKVWDLATNKIVKSFDLDWVIGVAFSPDGKKLIGKNGPKLVIWDFQTGEKLFDIPMKGGSKIYVSKLGTIAIHRRKGLLQLHNIEDGKLIRVLNFNIAAHQVDFSADGTILAVACQDWSAQLWDAISGKKIKELRRHNRPVKSVALSSDGKLLASGDNTSEIIIWNLADFKLAKRIQVTGSRVDALAFSPDSTRLASGVANGLIEMWDVKSGRRLHAYKGHEFLVSNLKFISDGRILASSSLDRTVKLWDSTPVPQILGKKQHANLVFDVAINTERSLIALGRQENNKAVDVYNFKTGRLQYSFKHKKGVPGVAFSPSGNILATNSQDKIVRIFDLDNGTLRQELKGQTKSGNKVIFTKDGRLLLSSSGDNTIRIWDVQSGMQLPQIELQNGRANQIRLNFDESLLAAGVRESDKSSIHVWNFKTGKIEQVIPSPGGVRNLAFDPNSNQLVSHHGARLTQFWNVTTGKESRPKLYYNTQGFSIDFHPAGNRVAFGLGDHKMRIYEFDSMEEVFYSHHHSDRIKDIKFSPDGNILVSGSYDGTARILDARPDTPELHTELEAYSVLRFLTAQKLSKEETIKRIENDLSIGPKIRRLANRYLNEFYD